MHELPQELGDFGALLHAGYSRSRALGYNFISALSFPVGGVIAFVVDGQFDVRVLVALGAGNFIYIAASGLIPEVKKAANLTDTLGRFGAFATGVGILYAASVIKNSHLLG
jgi:zinc and cadmium transporter